MENNLNMSISYIINELELKYKDAKQQQTKCRTDRAYFWLGKSEAYNELIIKLKQQFKIPFK